MHLEIIQVSVKRVAGFKQVIPGANIVKRNKRCKGDPDTICIRIHVFGTFRIIRHAWVICCAGQGDADRWFDHFNGVNASGKLVANDEASS